MKVGEILRNLADQIDAAAANNVQGIKAIQTPEPENVPAEIDAAQDCCTGDTGTEIGSVTVINKDATDTNTMVPPLQQKHELLKKAGEIDNNVDDFALGDEMSGDDDAELALMKKMAGIGEPQVNADVSQMVQPVEINPKKNAALAQFHQDDFDSE